MRSRAAAILLALALVAAPAAPASADEDTAAHVDDAQLRWGINNESNNAAFAPGTSNFFSAGRIADPGRGGVVVTQSDWSASEGNVSIEKWNGSAYAPATWAGLRTDSAGTPITSPSSGRFSNHTIVLEHGTGTVDPTTRSAEISWDGDVTVLYYSGMSFFYVSDPVLTVTDGVGTLTATLSGFTSSMDDTSRWEPVAPRTATLADLGTVDLDDVQGFTSTPRYAGIKVTGVDQVGGSAAGSFPQSFIDFQKVAGAAAYWYSSGGATDAFKAALPMTVSYDASDAVIPTPPATTGGGDAGTNEIVRPPTPSTTSTTPAPAAPSIVLPPEAAVPVATDRAAPGFQQIAQPVTTRAVALTTDDPSSDAVWWWLGGILMLLAASTLTGTLVFSAASSRR
jgi:hypothetical protein